MVDIDEKRDKNPLYLAGLISKKHASGRALEITRFLKSHLKVSSPAAPRLFRNYS
jgi:hypothetical protein